MQKIFDDPHIQLKKIFEVRWLSFHSAVDSMRRTMVSVMATLEADAAEGDPSVSGLLKTMRSYNFICLTNLFTDVLGIITKLSKLFQKEVLDFSVIQPSISNSIEALLQLKHHDGLHLITCKQEICGNMYHNQPIENSSAQQRTFESAKSQFIQAVVDNMRSQFTDIGVLSACQIFDPQNLPKNPTDLVSYGNTQLDVLLKHYSPKVPATTVSASSSVTDTQPLINPEECRSEFVLFKQFMFRTFPNKCYPELIKEVTTKYGDLFPQMSKLLSIIAVIPVSSASCERGFSTANRIKNRLRNRLKVTSVNRLMCISIEGPNISQFRFDKALNNFKNMKMRRIFTY